MKNINEIPSPQKNKCFILQMKQTELKSPSIINARKSLDLTFKYI